MMQYHFAGDSVSIYVPFLVDREFVVPDTGSVSYTLRDTKGAIVAGHSDVDVTTDENTTSVVIEIPSAANQKTNAVELRSMVVKYQYDGQSRQVLIRWGLLDWVNLFVEADDVRNLLGLNTFELTDDQVNLVSAYHAVKADVSDIDDLLVSGETSQLQANELIALKAALLVMPSVQMRANKREKSDAVEFERMGNIDFRKLASDLAAEYAGLVGQLTGVDETTPTLFTVSSPTDPVTGA